MPNPLGHEFKLATIAPVGDENAGNWSAVFSQTDINIGLTRFECYRIVVKDGPKGSTFDVLINNTNVYDSVFPGWSTSWDPNHAMELTNGDTVTYRWDSAAAPAPTVWMYFQEASPL